MSILFFSDFTYGYIKYIIGSKKEHIETSVRAIKEKIEEIRFNPRSYFHQEISNIQFDKNLDTIEDLLCVLFAGTASLNDELFQRLSLEVKEYAEFDENPEYQFYYFIASGSFYRHLNEMHFALECFEKANKLSYIINDPEHIVKSLSYLSTVYGSVKDFDLALYYAEQALLMLDSLDNPALSADIFNSFGYILQNMGEPERAKESYLKALDYYNKVPDFNNYLNYCILVLNMGEVSLMLNHHEEAEIYFNEGIKITEKNQYNDFLEDLLITIAEVYHKQKLHYKSYEYLKEYIDKKNKTNTAGVKVEAVYDKNKLKEELATLSVLRNKNQNLHNRLNNLYETLDENEKKLSEQKVLFLKLNEAICNNEIVSYFQPKWSLTEKKFTGAEALARWVTKDGSIIYPDKFISLIEESHMICVLSSQIIKQSFQFCKEVVSTINADFIISVNIAPYQLIHQNLISLIEKELILNDLKPGNVEIEITERTFLENNPKAMTQLYELKGMGVKIALDDFGVGYSSLSALNRIPFDSVKIDRSLMLNAATVDNGIKMLGGIIHLMHDLDFHVVTEGVETIDHVNLLNRFKCDEVQGYFYSKAVRGADLMKLLFKS